MKKNGKIIFIADAHLVDAPDSSDGFFEFLKKIGESEYQIVFLGDIFELWIAFDAYEEPIHRRFLEWCRTEKERRMVGFLEGNHEFYVAWRHGDAFTWAAESTHCLSNGKICLMHGDRVNESDFLYRVFREFMRNPVTRLVVRLAGPGIGRALSQKILYGLKNKNMRYKKNFPERYFCRLADEMEKKNFDLIISDIMMDGEDGFEFAATVRQNDKEKPIIFVSARSDIESKAKGFNLGIDDYMTKPIDFDELIMRINALLRRAKIATEKKLIIGELVMDSEEMTAYLRGEEVPLTVREFNILFKLLSFPKKTFTRMQLLNEFWSLDSSTGTRSIDVYITKIREKFASCDDFEILTVHGLGYKAVIK